MGAFYKSIDTVLWGRKTCDIALDFQKKGVTGSAFDTRVKNYVFTRTLLQSPAPAGVEFVSEPVKAFATRLRGKKGKDIWMMGGAGIIASFLDEGEIDDFMIHVIPTFIGEGIPLIAPGHRTVPLKLLSCTKLPSGVVKLHYTVRKQSHIWQPLGTQFLQPASSQGWPQPRHVERSPPGAWRARSASHPGRLHIASGRSIRSGWSLIHLGSEVEHDGLPLAG